MRHWSRLATRNWQVKQVRTFGGILAIALGVGAVVWVSCCYESVRQSVMGWAQDYVGASHINVQSPWGKHSAFAARIIPSIEALPQVEHLAPLLVQRLRGKAIPRAEYAEGERYDPWTSPEVDYYGIDLEREFAIREYELAAGRMLTPEDTFATVLEAAHAADKGVGLGDYLIIWSEDGSAQYKLEIVGLIDRRRIARFMPAKALVLLPILQEINNKFALVTSIDVALVQDDLGTINDVAMHIRQIIQRSGVQAHVTSAQRRMEQVEHAQTQQEVVLALLSCVAMLTSLFIILSTLSMGMLERITQLGLLRCVGATGRQLASLVFLEVAPLGIVGIVAGIPLGLLLTQITVWLVPEYVGGFTISWRGIGLAVIAGLGTTLVAAVLPALATLSVSPLEASHPRARLPRRTPIIVAFVLALALLAVQWFILQQKVQRDFAFVQWSSTAVVLLYLVYALTAPIVIYLLSVPAVALIARLVAVRARLLQDQVGYAIWRSVGICCGLMVGLSLIVTLVVVNHSFRAGWDFPRQFPEAYIWDYDQFPVTAEEARAEISSVQHVGEFTVANALNVIVEENPQGPLADVLRSVTWFLGVEPDSFLDLVKMEFVEGDERTARMLLKQGGYVLIAQDFARSRKKGFIEDPERGITNTVNVWFSDRGVRHFRVAGVVDSPALDIAANYFQVESEARVAATGSVIGTNRDLQRYFGIDSAKLILLNFDMPPAPVPPDWPPPRGTRAAFGLPLDVYDEDIPLETRWQRHREELVLRDVADRVDAHRAYIGTARELKSRIDQQLTEVTYLLTAVPAVALLVAAIGVANLMTANVASRMKQLAILRAVGATRGQILRMVIGEALVLGVLGSGLGLALGLHLASNVSQMTVAFWGYAVAVQIPWALVLAAIVLTVGLCIIAGVLPARHAARTNVIDALHVP